MKRLSLMLGALALGLAACATSTGTGWQERHAAGEAAREAVRFAETPLLDAWSPAVVTTTPVPINEADLEAGTGALIYRGGIHITSTFDRLHGLSDLAFEDATRFWSISDEGLLVRGRIRLDADGRLVGLDGVEARPLTDPDHRPLIPKVLADAEGLALMPDGEILVSFERVHRVWRYARETGRYRGERVIPDFAFTENEGLEGIAFAGGSDYWAAGENGGLWLCRIAACEEREAPPATPPTDDDLRATGLTTLDGVVYVVRRAFHQERGTNTIRLSRLVPGQDEVVLATFTGPATVDNFEGIAAVRRADGGVRLYILSDDNFNARQRTLMLAFDVR